jgi:hypothetical protein
MTNSDLISTGKKINIDGGSQSLPLILSDRSMLEARQASGNGKVERDLVRFDKAAEQL